MPLRHCRKRFWHGPRGRLAASAVSMLMACVGSWAQVILDGSLSPAGPLTGPIYNIGADRGQIQGANLFHSFAEFNVHAGEKAVFTGPGTIANIVSRVTGGSASSIDGQIDTRNAMPTANFFLLNPNGVLLGPKAELNIGGSFHASTADYLRFADDAKFFAKLSGQSTLTVAEPVAFGFLGSSAGSIHISGSSLTVDPAKTLSLVGTTIAVTKATLSAPGGRIQLQSAERGEVPVASATSGMGGTIEVGDSTLDATGGPAGTVVIRGGRLLIHDGAKLLVDRLGDSQDRRVGIDLQASGQITLTGAIVANSNADAGRGSDINIKADRVDIVGGTSIESTTSGPGAGGNILIEANHLQLDDAAVASRAEAGGAGGDVTIDAGDVAMNLGFISAVKTGATPGVGGSISVDARSTIDLVDAEVLSQADTSGSGGSVRFSADRIQLSGSFVSTIASGSATGGNVAMEGRALTLDLSSVASQKVGTGTGRGGDISITGSDSVVLSAGEILSVTSTGGVGGSVTIAALSVEMTEAAVLSISRGTGGAISLQSENLSLAGGALVTTSGTVNATAGNLTVDAGSAVIADEGSGLFAFPDGAGGDLTARFGSLMLTRGAIIQVGSFGGKRGGNLSITAKSLTLSQNAGIVSEAFTQDVGPISIVADALLIDNGYISTSTLEIGRAGDVALSVGSLTLLNGGQIASSSLDPASGAGGDVTVAATGAVAISGSSPTGRSPIPGLFESGESSSGIYSTSSSGNPDARPAGSISVSSPRLTLAEGGKLSVASTGPGDAGKIVLDVGTLTVTSGAAITSNTSGAGNAGAISIAGNAFNLTGGGRIDSGTSGAGHGGTITLAAANSLSLAAGAGVFSNASDTGPGGDINITARHIDMLSGSTISASSTGNAAAPAGSVNIVFGDTLRLDHSSIATRSVSADGGSISITSTGSTLTLINSQITTSVASGSGSGGKITIGSHLHPLTFVILTGSQILTTAVGGNGGDINIFADTYLTSESLVDASSLQRDPGTINVEARITDLSGSLAELPDNFLQAANLLRAACAARVSGGKASSLVVASREGVPAEPGGLLASPLGTTLAALGAALDDEYVAQPSLQLAGLWPRSNCAR